MATIASHELRITEAIRMQISTSIKLAGLPTTVNVNELSERQQLAGYLNYLSAQLHVLITVWAATRETGEFTGHTEV